jgi:hypothetical protein
MIEVSIHVIGMAVTFFDQCNTTDEPARSSDEQLSTMRNDNDSPSFF